MIILLLTITLAVMTIVIFLTSRERLITTSLIVSLSFLIASLLYIINYKIIGSDISFISAMTIIGSVLSFWIGEYVAKHIKIGKKARIKWPESTNLVLRMKKFAFRIFILCIAIFLIRYYDLYRYLVEKGEYTGLFSVLSDIRLDYATGLYVDRGIVMQIVIYVTILLEIISYIYLYYYIRSRIVYKKNELKLLFPIVGYLLIILTFTGRTGYIEYLSVFLTMFIYTFYKCRSLYASPEEYKSRAMIQRIAKIIALFAILFFGYQFIFRNDESTLAKSITAYIAAPLYGYSIMDGKLFYGINGQNMTFGYYTFQYIHSMINSLLGTRIPVPVFHNLPFFEYAKGSSNIYTSLLFSYLDFGYGGVLVTRCILGFISGFTLNILLKCYNPSDLRTIPCLVFYGLLFNAALSAAIADRYAGLLLDPNSIIKYLIVSPIVIYIFHNIINRKVKI